MKGFHLLLILLFPGSLLRGQELVVNGSFEDSFTPYFFGQAWLAKDVNVIYGSPDLFSWYSGPAYVGVPTNGFGSIWPFHGYNYLGLGFDMDSLQTEIIYREGFQLKLTQPLEANVTYCLSIKIALAQRAQMIPTGLDVLATVQGLENSPETYRSTPRAEIPVGAIPDTGKWNHFTVDLPARGGEKYLSFGFFREVDEYDITGNTTRAVPFGYYYIDSVSLTACYEFPEVTVPNVFSPNGDGVNDVFSLDLKDARVEQMDIFNRWGALVHSTSGGSWDGTCSNGSKASPGVYFYSLVIRAKNGEAKPFKGTLTLFE